MAVSDEELIGIISKNADPMQSGEMVMLVYRYTRVIKIKAAKLCTPETDPEDLQQEGYIALFDAVRTYDPEKGGFSAYAGKCITNRMKNYVLKVKGKLEKADDYDLGQIMDSKAVTDEYVIVKEYDEEMKKKLSSILTDKEYEVLKLYLDGYSYKQISEQRGISVKSVDNSLSRTRKKLKKAL